MEMLTKSDIEKIKAIFLPLVNARTESYFTQGYAKADAWKEFLRLKPKGTDKTTVQVMSEMFNESWASLEEGK